uniref:Uncharacterized protein n=1 Tax=Nelumbo nucifera TaxID=4432 RepID=A0A822ZXS9_NELNU|nr:TPA_asm: hypothetical protein HUJ06_016655 [Nelumbo nucifera]
MKGCILIVMIGTMVFIMPIVLWSCFGSHKGSSLHYSLETTRHVSMITITLSKKELDKSSIG